MTRSATGSTCPRKARQGAASAAHHSPLETITALTSESLLFPATIADAALQFSQPHGTIRAICVATGVYSLTVQNNALPGKKGKILITDTSGCSAFEDQEKPGISISGASLEPDQARL